MAPKVPPPSDPTSLLWAHQIKREHGLLLQKVEKLEVAISRIEALDSAAQNRENDIAAMAKKIESITGEVYRKNSAATEQAVAKVRQEVTNQFEDLDERVEAIANKLDAVDKAGETAADNRKDAFDREVAMLKRVKGLEASWTTHRDNMALLGRKIEDAEVDRHQAQLAKLMHSAKDAGEDRERVKEVLAMLENTTEALKRDNEKLEDQVSALREELREEMRSIAAKAAEAAVPARVPRSDKTMIPTPAPKPAAIALTKKTTASLDTATTDPAPKSSTAPSSKGRSKQSTASTTKPPGDRPLKRELAGLKHHNSSPQKSTRRAIKPIASATLKPTGDRPMKRELAGLMRDVSPHEVKRSTVKSMNTTRPAAFKQGVKTIADMQLDEETQKPIAKQGKGWVRIIEVVSDDDDEEDLAELAALVPPSNTMQIRTSVGRSGAPIPTKKAPGRPRKNPIAAATTSSETPKVVTPPVKRGPGRPRKLVRQASIQRSIEQVDAPVPKRRTIQQNDNTQARAVFGTSAKGKKRKVDADAINDTMDLSAPRASRSQSGTPAPAPAKRQKLKAAAPPQPVQMYGKSKVKSRGGTPATSKTLSAPPVVNDAVQDLLDAAESAQDTINVPVVQKVSRKRTIPQLDDEAFSRSETKRGKEWADFQRNQTERLAEVNERLSGFDKDFEM